MIDTIILCMKELRLPEYLNLILFIILHNFIRQAKQTRQIILLNTISLPISDYETRRICNRLHPRGEINVLGSLDPYHSARQGTPLQTQDRHHSPGPDVWQESRRCAVRLRRPSLCLHIRRSRLPDSNSSPSRFQAGMVEVFRRDAGTLQLQ